MDSCSIWLTSILWLNPLSSASRWLAQMWVTLRQTYVVQSSPTSCTAYQILHWSLQLMVLTCQHATAFCSFSVRSVAHNELHHKHKNCNTNLNFYLVQVMTSVALEVVMVALMTCVAKDCPRPPAPGHQRYILCLSQDKVSVEGAAAAATTAYFCLLIFFYHFLWLL